MQEQSTFCPECGAPAAFRGPAVSLVCEYCESTIVRTGVDVSLVGKVSALADTGSPVLLGSRGSFKNVPFEVAGRIQVTYDRGTWNEWFLTFADGTIGWLADAMGQYAIVRPKAQNIVDGKVPVFPALSVNSVLVIDGVEFLLTDKRGAAYKGAEGSLPFDARPGMTFFAADLRGFNGEFMTLDYGNNPNHAKPVPYLGESVVLPEVKLHPLRKFEGWREHG